MTEFLYLLLAFQFKHLIADYYLQFPYMYENKGKPTGWINPLMDHSMIHASMTFFIILGYMIITGHYNFYLPVAALIFDFVSHFAIDRWKATQGSTPDQAKFWQQLGIDQMLHHIVGILIIYTTLTITG